MGNQYKNNFLSNVIVRVDFPTSLQIDEKLHVDFLKSILGLFPISEPKTIVEREIKFGPDQRIELKADEMGIERNYYGKNREKKLVISQNFLVITYKEYNSFEHLKSEFLTIVENLFESFPDIQINRLGLRYINQIELDEPNPTDWKEYLHEDLLSIFNIAEDVTNIARGVHNLVLNYGDMFLSFQYGMHNPDMPAPIRKKLFVLDYDAYHTDLQDLTEMKSNLIKLHHEIEKLFERNIKDKLREKMVKE